MNAIGKFMIVISLSLIFLSACASAQTAPPIDFKEPDPETYVRLIPVIREYFYLRKQSTLSGDTTPFFQRYPALAEGMETEKGINIESKHFAGMQDFDLVDGNFFPEYYEKIKISQNDTEWRVLVHGMGLYAYRDADGMINESGGEFKIVFLLQEKDDTFMIAQTDEVTLAEWKDFTP
jgi:hypothetical protein